MTNIDLLQTITLLKVKRDFFLQDKNFSLA